MLKQQWRPASTMLVLGFSAGLPILLIFSTLSLWLAQAGVEKSAVTYFSWAALGYSFKFVWAPLVDQLEVPYLSRWLGRRRAWLLLSQFMVMASIVGMALTDPARDAGLTSMALAAVALGFSSATQDVVIDAFRIEVADKEVQALLASTYIAGYRLGMLVAGALALYLAAWFGASADHYLYDAWRSSYFCMAAFMLVGVATTLIVREPKFSIPLTHRPVQEQLRFVLLFAIMVSALVVCFWLSGTTVAELKTAWKPGNRGGDAVVSTFVESMRLFLAFAAAAASAWCLVRFNAVPMQLVQQGYISPVMEFMGRYGRSAWIILLLVGFYKISDIVMGAVANIFYQDMGFDLTTIANVTKVFGLWCTLIGGFAGGLLCMRYGVMRMMFVGAILTAATNVLFMLLASGEPSTAWLALVISADNLSAGMAGAAFIAYLSSLTNVSFTAVQYALFSSLMTLFPKLMSGYSGSIVESMGYANFFLGTALLGVPVLLLVYLAGRVLAVGRS